MNYRAISPKGGVIVKGYEVLYIIRPDLEEEQTKALVAKFSQIVEDNGGTDLKVDVWGKRRLAYEIKKLNEGFYVLMKFNGEAATVQELERVMKISEEVIRYLTTRDE